MKKIIYLTLMLASAAVSAQTFQWLLTPQSTMPYNPDLIGYSTATDASGNIFYTGYKKDPFLYNSIMGTLFLDKYTSAGEFLFTKAITGNAQAYNMVTDNNGNVILALGYVNTITIEDITLSTVNQDEQWLIAKFDASGNLIWHYTPVIDEPEGSGLNIISQCKSLALDASDNIYIGYGNFTNSYITKLSSAGSVLSSIEQADVTRITSLSVDNQGNIYAAGSCTNTAATFAGVTNGTELPYNIYLVKYSASGEYQWVKFVEDVTCSEPHVVTRSPDEVYFCSNLSGAFQFDQFTADGTPFGWEDFFLAKLNASGAYQWLREVPADGRALLGNRNFLNLDADGNIYIAGSTIGDVNWGNGITTSDTGWGNVALLLKYNPEGSIVMAKTAGGETFTRFDGVSTDASNNMYMGGMGMGPATFDAIMYDPQQVTAFYPYMVKLSNGLLGTNIPQYKTISLYPNPASSSITIYGLDAALKGTITNTIGQKVKDFETGNNAAVNVADLPQGTYFIQADGFKAAKFIKQ